MRMSPLPQKTDVVRTRVTPPLLAKIHRRMKRLGLDQVSDYLRRLIQIDVGEIKEL